MGHLGIQPSEFWAMTAQEFFLLYDTRRDKNPNMDYAGKLTEKDCAELYDMLGN